MHSTTYRELEGDSHEGINSTIYNVSAIKYAIDCTCPIWNDSNLHFKRAKLLKRVLETKRYKNWYTENYKIILSTILKNI